MGIWMWCQANKKFWRVETDAEKGIIKVYDENGVIISNRDGLSEGAVGLIEDNFFDVVAERVDESFIKVKDDEFNPMYV